MKLALLSNVTADVLAKMLAPEHEVWLAPGYGGWMEIALDVPEDLRSFAPEAVLLVLDVAHTPVDENAVERARTALEDALPRSSVFALDLADLVQESGVDFYDARMWQLASMPWSLAGLEVLRSEINRLLGFLRGGVRKALAVDLDGFLWRGVIGEDGVDGIRPDEARQRAIRDLVRRGIVLVALSKNNAVDVEPVWQDARMVLGKEDFALLCLDWRDKPSNLQQAAQTLNLGLDAFVFLDDNPVERAEMRAALPDVAVPENPFDIRRITRLFFPTVRLGAEDRARTALYRAESARQAVRAQKSDLAAYLADLRIWVRIQPIVPDQYARVAQLAVRTNQFTVSCHRYTVEDVARLAADPEHVILTAYAGDRFGEQGLVAFVHVACAGSEGEIVDWVMSCRAMNRRIEFSVQQAVEEHMRARGVRRLVAQYVRTPKNAPVENLFEHFGFTCLKAEPSVKTYMRPL